LWDDVLAGRDATVQRRAQVRLASWHAVTSAVQAVDLIYLTGGVTQHMGVHPRVLETAGRVLFGLEPDTPTLML
jgi:hypothetical protein